MNIVANDHVVALEVPRSVDIVDRVTGAVRSIRVAAEDDGLASKIVLTDTPSDTATDLPLGTALDVSAQEIDVVTARNEVLIVPLRRSLRDRALSAGKARECKCRRWE